MILAMMMLLLVRIDERNYYKSICFTILLSIYFDLSINLEQNDGTQKDHKKDSGRKRNIWWREREREKDHWKIILSHHLLPYFDSIYLTIWLYLSPTVKCLTIHFHFNHVHLPDLANFHPHLFLITKTVKKATLVNFLKHFEGILFHRLMLISIHNKIILL